MSNFQLVTTKHFDGIEFNCYQDTQEQNINDFWATRTQIGQALEYYCRDLTENLLAGFQRQRTIRGRGGGAT